MKKRFLILAGVLALTVAVSGCGKKKDTDVQPVAASATPTPEVTKAAEIVDMKQPTEEEIANIMGEESATASKVIFVNNMGSDISSVYIRQHVEDEDDSDDDTWGSDLVDGKFTLKDKDKALYIFHRMQRKIALRVLPLMIFVWDLLMKIRMSAFSGTFLWVLFHRSLSV